MDNFLSIILDFIFPRYCCICQRYLSISNYRYLCDQCAQKITFPGTNLCPKCGYDFGEKNFQYDSYHRCLGQNDPYTPKIILPEVNLCSKWEYDSGGKGAQYDPSCPRCLNQNFHFQSLQSAVHLNKIVKRLIHRFKYRNGEHLISDLGKIAQQNTNFITFLMDSVLIPVPLHWRRYFGREYNQSELLVRALIKLPIRAKALNLLRRARFTRPQVELHATERCRNIQHAFRVNTSIKIPLDTRLIVFDDILTTGSTINECCKTLQEHGFSNIYAATFAQTHEEEKTV